MQLAVANSELVHELQKERGLTSGFYGSGGSAEFKQKLSSQRLQADSKKQVKLNETKALMPLIKDLGLDGLKQRNARILEELNTIRAQVDAQSIPFSEVLAFYNHINASLLNVVSSIAELAHSPEIKQQGLAYYYFSQAKERAGIERALLSNVFAADTISLPRYTRFKELVLLQNTYLKEFENLAGNEMLQAYQQEMQGRAITEVKDFRATLVEHNLNGQYQVSATDWFNSATKRINQLKQTEDQVAKLLVGHAQAERDKLSMLNWTYIIVGLIVAAACLGVATVITRGVNKQVRSLVATLNYCAESSALDKTFSVEGRDEFSYIAKALNNVFASFRNAIIKITESSEMLAASAEQNSVTSANRVQH